MMDTKKDFEPEMFRYAHSTREKELRGLFEGCQEEFPEKDWDFPDETWVNNYLSWLLYEKARPETGKTFAEEFAESRSDLSPELRAAVPSLRNMVRSEFIVLSRKEAVILLKDMKTENRYDVCIDDGGMAAPNDVIRGRIHLFGCHYAFAGAYQMKCSPMILDPEILLEYHNDSQIERYESALIYPNTPLLAVLRKYPFQWVDGIYARLKLRGDRLKDDKLRSIEGRLKGGMEDVLAALPQESRDALRLVLGNGGFVKYGALRGFGDRIGFWWNERPEGQDSAIGLLRTHGLLAVGRMGFGRKSFRTALIPSDLREPMLLALGGKREEMKTR